MRPTDFIEPCLPMMSRTVPTSAGWAYEIKHDGFRFICRRDGEHVRLFSRGGHDWSVQLPAIVAAMRALPVTSVTLDGEVVICGADGVSQSERLTRSAEQAPKVHRPRAAAGAKDLRGDRRAPQQRKLVSNWPERRVIFQ